MATEEEREIARLEAESLKEYTSTQDAVIQQAKASRASAAIPPELAGMDLSGTAIGSIVDAEIETDLRYGIAVFVVGKFVCVEQFEFFFFTVFR